MIILRNKNFSKQISREEKEKNRKRAEIALGAIKVTPGAAAGLLIGEGVKKGIESKLEKDKLRLILSGSDVVDSMRDYVDNLKNNPNPLNSLDRSALNASNEWERKFDRHSKLEKFSKNKVFRYGLPAMLSIASGYANKKVVDSIANKSLKRKSKNESTKSKK